MTRAGNRLRYCKAHQWRWVRLFGRWFTSRTLRHDQPFRQPSCRSEDPLYILCSNGLLEPIRISRYSPGMRTEPIFLVCGLGIILLSAAVGSDRFHRVGPSEIYPDAVRTPGTGNPDITQQNIKDTICTRHWSTRTVRPPPQYTSKLKRRQLREYGDTVHQGRAELINSSTGKVDITRCPLRSDNTACYERGSLDFPGRRWQSCSPHKSMAREAADRHPGQLLYFVPL